VNLKNVCLLKFEKFIRKAAKAEKKKLVEANKEYKRNLLQL
jgi:hypothetical protein